MKSQPAMIGEGLCCTMQVKAEYSIWQKLLQLAVRLKVIDASPRREGPFKAVYKWH
jgi:hypothetical protein